MSPPTPTTGDEVHPRGPLDGRGNGGGDVSMMFSVRARSPRRLAIPASTQIQGLNAETIAQVVFRPQTWLTIPEYGALRSDSDDDSSDCGFSLNMSIYNQTIVPSNWDDVWFFMYGRVHLSAFTWHAEAPDGPETGDGLQDYTIPALFVCGQCC